MGYHDSNLKETIAVALDFRSYFSQELPFTIEHDKLDAWAEAASVYFTNCDSATLNNRRQNFRERTNNATTSKQWRDFGVKTFILRPTRDRGATIVQTPFAAVIDEMEQSINKQVTTPQTNRIKVSRWVSSIDQSEYTPEELRKLYKRNELFNALMKSNESNSNLISVVYSNIDESELQLGINIIYPKLPK